ncbi:unnamed protein product, partial [Amoebophrya sp. A120]
QPRTFGSDVPRDDDSWAFQSASERTKKDQQAQGSARMRGLPYGKQHIAFVLEKRTADLFLNFRRNWFYPVHSHDKVLIDVPVNPEATHANPTEQKQRVKGIVLEMDGDAALQEKVKKNELEQDDEEIMKKTWRVCALLSETMRVKADYEKKGDLDSVRLFFTEREGDRNSWRQANVKEVKKLAFGRDGLSLTHAPGPGIKVDCNPGFRVTGKTTEELGKLEVNESLKSRLNGELPITDPQTRFVFYSTSKIPHFWQRKVQKQDVLAHAWSVQEGTERKDYADA